MQILNWFVGHGLVRISTEEADRSAGDRSRVNRKERGYYEITRMGATVVERLREGEGLPEVEELGFLKTHVDQFQTQKLMPIVNVNP